MSFFGQPQQPQGQQPSMFGGQMDPRMMQMIMQRMQGGGQPPMPPPPPPGQPAGMPPGGMNPVNVPQMPPMPGQSPMMGSGDPSQTNPLASVLGNQGGGMQPQGQIEQGSAMGGSGMGGLAQILNALKSQQQVNGQQPMQAPGGVDIEALMKAQGGQ